MASLLYCLPLGSNWLQNESTTKQFTTSLRQLKDDNSGVVFIGEEKSGKTQLLFQAAVSYASQNYNVTFISRYPLNHIPLPVHGMVRPETAGQLETLTFLYMNTTRVILVGDQLSLRLLHGKDRKEFLLGYKYMNTTRDVIQYLSSLHTKSVLPDVIIIDDFQHYLNNVDDPSHEVGCALLCAQFIDAMSFASTKGSLGVLLMGCSSQPKFVPSIMRQFKLGLAHISRISPESEDYRISLTLKDNRVSVLFNKQELGLFLKQITFHEQESNWVTLRR